MLNSNQAEIIKILKKTYPDARIVLNFGNPWELLVSVILSAQCTDIMVNKVTARLFNKYKTINDYASASPEEFETDIKSTGFYRSKAKNIIESAKIVQSKFNGQVPRTMEEMLTLKGVARKTANVVLGNAYQIVEGIAVDTHVLRISQRLRLVREGEAGGKKRVEFPKNGRNHLDYFKDADPVKVESILMKQIPKSDWFKLTYLIIDHGRAVCRAQNPKCSECPLATLCPVSR